MEKNLKQQFKSFSLTALGASFGRVWQLVYVYVAWAFLLMSVTYVIYAGYVSLYVGAPDEEKYEIYIRGQESKSRLNQENFDGLRVIIDARAAKREQPHVSVPDIFYTPGFEEKDETENVETEPQRTPSPITDSVPEPTPPSADTSPEVTDGGLEENSQIR